MPPPVETTPATEQADTTNSEVNGDTNPKEGPNPKPDIDIKEESDIPDKKSKMALSTLVLPPELKEGFYESYKKEVEVWKLLKTCSDVEQGPILCRSLKGRAKVAALTLDVNEIGGKDGAEKILAKLDKLYLPEKNQRIITVLDRFESFKRSPEMTVASFILEFERLHSQLQEYGCTYPDGVLAYRIMKAANISKEHEQLCRATVETDKWSYAAVLQQLRKIFNDFTAVKSDSNTNNDRPVKLEETYIAREEQTRDCYFNNNNYDDYNTIQYDNYTDKEYDTGNLANETNSYNSNEGYREPEEFDIYYGPSRSGRTSPWKFNSNNVVAIYRERILL